MPIGAGTCRRLPHEFIRLSLYNIVIRQIINYDIYKAIGGKMFNFDEEIAGFSPSLEIDQAEEAVLDSKNIDITDILEALLHSGKETRETK